MLIFYKIKGTKMKNTYFRILFLSLLVKFHISQISECEKKTPSSPSDCKGLETKDATYETCCYVKGQVEGKKNLTSECLNLKKSDTKTKASLRRVIDFLYKGSYGSLNKTYKDIDELICYNDADQAVSYKFSLCERASNPKELSDCKDRSPAGSYEKCCYMKGMQYGEESTECVDINKNDDPNKIKEKIKNGTYWPNYDLTYEEIIELECPEVDLDDEEVKDSSFYLTKGILTFLLAFL